MNSKNLFYQKGYIALMSAVVISVLLLTITLSLGLSGFFGRLNIVDSESKERSIALAEACVDTAILEIAKGTNYTGQVNVDSDSCTIVSIMPDTPSSGQTTIKTQAVVNKSYTNFEVIINSKNFSIISWEECPVLSSC